MTDFDTRFSDRMEEYLRRREEQAKKDGRQAYPHTKIKQGAILYKVDVVEWDNGSTSISIDHWIIRSIRRKRGTQTPIGKLRGGDNSPVYVNLTAKVKNVTWVRQSRKVQDFGWSKSIPNNYRSQFEVGSRLPHGIFTTPLAALKWSLKDHIKGLESIIAYRNQTSDRLDIEEWDSEIEHRKKTIRLLKSRVAKFATRKQVN